jgi:hypothetical protein
MFAGQYKMFGPYNNTNLNEIAAPNVAFNTPSWSIWSYIDGKYWMVPLNLKGAATDPGLHVYNAASGCVYSPTCPPNGAQYRTDIGVNYRVHWGRLTTTTVPYVGTTYTRDWTLQCNFSSYSSTGNFSWTARHVGTPNRKVTLYSIGTTYFDVESGTLSSKNNNTLMFVRTAACRFSIHNPYGQHPLIWEQEQNAAGVIFTATSSSPTKDFYTTPQTRTWRFYTPNDFGLNYR